MFFHMPRLSAAFLGSGFLLIAIAAPVPAQRVPRGPTITAQSIGLVRQVRATPVDSSPRTRRFPVTNIGSEHRANHALLGGLIGGVAGLFVCTAISTAINEGTGVSTCTRKGNLFFGLGGFAVGALVGSRIR